MYWVALPALLAPKLASIALSEVFPCGREPSQALEQVQHDWDF